MAHRAFRRDHAGASLPSASISQPPAPRERGAGRRGAPPTAPILLQLLAMLGIGALLYPAAANWFAALRHDAEISGYVRSVETLPPEAVLRELDAADAYNAGLPPGPLVDPFGPAAAPTSSSSESYRAYERLLGVAGTDVMGELVYPGLGIDLPIRHGAGEDALSRGAGHLFGSSLPVGGASTHAVLTAHSGLVNATLFSGLHDARRGDVFAVRVLGENRFYEVERIETVLPSQTGSLGIVAGEDRVTLLTCTPIGVNSHRLLVHGVRVPAPAVDEAALAGDGLAAGFPWWAVGFVGGSAAVAALLFAPNPRRRPRPHPARCRASGSAAPPATTSTSPSTAPPARTGSGKEN